MIRMATWNVERATPETKAGKRIRQVIKQIDADIFVLTEGCADLLPPSGHVIDGGTNWGYEMQDDRQRKVLIWSKNPWSAVDQLGSPELPPGRFIAGTTQNPHGNLRVIGVCIPWWSAHTNSGYKNRKNWEDHETYLTHLAPLLIAGSAPLVVAGDFNQRIPRGRQPQRMYDALIETFKGLNVSTVQTEAPALIDHIAHSPNLRAESLAIIPDTDEHGKLSDHRGAVVKFALA